MTGSFSTSAFTNSCLRARILLLDGTITVRTSKSGNVLEMCWRTLSKNDTIYFVTKDFSKKAKLRKNEKKSIFRGFFIQ
jgi:hypothetical protein